MTRIKICGIKKEEHAVAVAGAGADFMGFVFAPSPRQVTPSQVKKIVAALKNAGAEIEKVVVFTDTPLTTILHIAQTCELDWIQLSGDEPGAFCSELARPVIKVIRISRNYRPDDICRQMDYFSKLLGNQRHIFMLDSSARGKYGGTGQKFDWKHARFIAERFPVMVAGGLTPENVTEAMEIMKPWGVDVSSGVETQGVKDLEKIHRFIDNVRKHDAASA
ncbi:MAG: phosphoribosylanthranilate isomerase [Dehalococcoidales bacterium]|nr:phosphoribosylanthranilate isomerase [Dehalococcoidales bacterium]